MKIKFDGAYPALVDDQNQKEWIHFLVINFLTNVERQGTPFEEILGPKDAEGQLEVDVEIKINGHDVDFMVLVNRLIDAWAKRETDIADKARELLEQVLGDLADNLIDLFEKSLERAQEV